MGRRRKRGVNGEPWLRAENDGWYVKVEGRKVALTDKFGAIIKGKDREAEARTAWHDLMAASRAPYEKDEAQLRVVLDLYLQWIERTARQQTLEMYRGYFKCFLEKWPGLRVCDLKPRHLREWWDERHANWGDSTRNNSGTAFKAALNWARGADGDNLLTLNPLDGMSLPPMGKRGVEVLISDAEHDRLIKAVPEDLRIVLIALRHTGTRPSNIWRATPRDFHPDRHCFLLGGRRRARRHVYDPKNPQHKTQKKTGKVLVVPLTPLVVRLCEGLRGRLKEEFGEPAYLDQPLFRTAKGEPWYPAKLASRLLWYKKKMGLEHIICYGYRHTAGTDMIEGGVAAGTAGAVLGQDNPATVTRNYVQARGVALAAVLEEYRKPSKAESKLLADLIGTSKAGRRKATA